MNVIYLGLLFCEQSQQEAYQYSKCGVQMATHIFQKNLIRGLSEQEEINLFVINIPPVGSYPFHYRKATIPTIQWESNCRQIGYINIPFVKQKIQTARIVDSIEKVLVTGQKNYILFYTLYEPFLKAVSIVKQRNPDIAVCMIQTDAVDGRNGMDKYMTKRAIRRGNRQVAYARNCDCFVLLTEHLKHPLEVGSRPYIVMECICDQTLKKNNQHEVGERICLYTGAIDKAYGIIEMLNAFAKIPDAQLWICGTGDAEKEVKEVASTNANIKYYGFVNQERVFELRDQCDFLINPRQPDNSYTLYSFPSKTSEYMMSGKPTIMYKLPGVPDEYDEYLNYLTELNAEAITQELIAIFSQEYSELVCKANQGRQFMLEKKNSTYQAHRILQLMGESLS